MIIRIISICLVVLFICQNIAYACPIRDCLQRRSPLQDEDFRGLVTTAGQGDVSPAELMTTGGRISVQRPVAGVELVQLVELTIPGVMSREDSEDDKIAKKSIAKRKTMELMEKIYRNELSFLDKKIMGRIWYPLAEALLNAIYHGYGCTLNIQGKYKAGSLIEVICMVTDNGDGIVDLDEQLIHSFRNHLIATEGYGRSDLLPGQRSNRGFRNIVRFPDTVILTTGGKVYQAQRLAEREDIGCIEYIYMNGWRDIKFVAIGESEQEGTTVEMIFNVKEGDIKPDADASGGGKGDGGGESVIAGRGFAGPLMILGTVMNFIHLFERISPRVRRMIERFLLGPYGRVFIVLTALCSVVIFSVFLSLIVPSNARAAGEEETAGEQTGDDTEEGTEGEETEEQETAGEETEPPTPEPGPTPEPIPGPTPEPTTEPAPEPIPTEAETDEELPGAIFEFGLGFGPSNESGILNGGISAALITDLPLRGEFIRLRLEAGYSGLKEDRFYLLDYNIRGTRGWAEEIQGIVGGSRGLVEGPAMFHAQLGVKLPTKLGSFLFHGGVLGLRRENDEGEPDYELHPIVGLYDEDEWEIYRKNIFFLGNVGVGLLYQPMNADRLMYEGGMHRGLTTNFLFGVGGRHVSFGLLNRTRLDVPVADLLASSLGVLTGGNNSGFFEHRLNRALVYGDLLGIERIGLDYRLIWDPFLEEQLALHLGIRPDHLLQLGFWGGLEAVVVPVQTITPGALERLEGSNRLETMQEYFTYLGFQPEFKPVFGTEILVDFPRDIFSLRWALVGHGIPTSSEWIPGTEFGLVVRPPKSPVVITVRFGNSAADCFGFVCDPRQWTGGIDLSFASPEELVQERFLRVDHRRFWQDIINIAFPINGEEKTEECRIIGRNRFRKKKNDIINVVLKTGESNSSDYIKFLEKYLKEKRVYVFVGTALTREAGIYAYRDPETGALYVDNIIFSHHGTLPDEYCQSILTEAAEAYFSETSTDKTEEDQVDGSDSSVPLEYVGDGDATLKAPGSLGLDEAGDDDREFLREQIEGVSFLERIDGVMEQAMERMPADSEVTINRIRIHTVESDLMGLQRDKSSSNPQDLIYVYHSLEDAVAGEDDNLHIYITSAFWEVLQNNLLMLAFILDHEWQENMLAQPKTHRKASLRAWQFTDETGMNVFYRFFIDELAKNRQISYLKRFKKRHVNDPGGFFYRYIEKTLILTEASGLGNFIVVDRLYEKLDDLDSHVRQSAILTLGEIAKVRCEFEEDIILKLYEKLDDSNEDIFCAAAQVLSEIAERGSVFAEDIRRKLFDKFGDQIPPLRGPLKADIKEGLIGKERITKDAIDSLTEKKLDTFYTCLESPNLYTRLYAVRELKSIAAEREEFVRDILVRLFAKLDDVYIEMRCDVAQAIGEIVGRRETVKSVSLEEFLLDKKQGFKLDEKDLIYGQYVLFALSETNDVDCLNLMLDRIRKAENHEQVSQFIKTAYNYYKLGKFNLFKKIIYRNKDIKIIELLSILKNGLIRILGIQDELSWKIYGGWRGVRRFMRIARQNPVLTMDIINKVIVTINYIKYGIGHDVLFRNDDYAGHGLSVLMVLLQQLLDSREVDALAKVQLTKLLPLGTEDQVSLARKKAEQLVDAEATAGSHSGYRRPLHIRVTDRIMDRVHNQPSSRDLVAIKAYRQWIESNGEEGSETLVELGYEVDSVDQIAASGNSVVLAACDDLIDALEKIYGKVGLDRLREVFEEWSEIVPEREGDKDLINNVILRSGRGEKTLDLLEQIVSIRKIMQDVINVSRGEIVYHTLKLNNMLDLLFHDVFTFNAVNVEDASMQDSIQLLKVTIENAVVNGHSSESMDVVVQELDHIEDVDNRESCLKLYSIARRVERYLNRVRADVVDRYQDVAEITAEAMNVKEEERIKVTDFSADMIRSDTVYLLSLALIGIKEKVVERVEIPNWQVVVGGRLEGRLHYIDDISKLAEVRDDEILVVPNIPNDCGPITGVRGIITFTEGSLLSHPAIRARQQGMPFCVCRARDSLEQYYGKTVSVNVAESGAVIEEIAELDAVQVSSSVKEPIAVSPAEMSRQYVFKSNEYLPEKVGNKAYGLYRLDQLQVQPKHLTLGFGLYNRILNNSINDSIREEVERLMVEVTIGELEDSEIKDKLLRMRMLIESLVIPNAVLRRVRENIIRQVGRGLVFLRSSTNAEDLAEYAGAGLYDSYGAIDPKDRGELELYIKKVWSSLWNERAFFDREENGIEHRDVGMAVLVQQMVPAEYSFVVHTRDPGDIGSDWIAIDIVQGLGETLVSGDYPGTAHSFLYNRKNGAIRTVSYANKDDKLILQNGKIVNATADYGSDMFAQRSPVAFEIIRKIGRAAKQVEKEFGKPQDIEGCIVQEAGGHRFVFVQSRDQQLDAVYLAVLELQRKYVQGRKIEAVEIDNILDPEQILSYIVSLDERQIEEYGGDRFIRYLLFYLKFSYIKNKTIAEYTNKLVELRDNDRVAESIRKAIAYKFRRRIWLSGSGMHELNRELTMPVLHFDGLGRILDTLAVTIGSEFEDFIEEEFSDDGGALYSEIGDQGGFSESFDLLLRAFQNRVTALWRKVRSLDDQKLEGKDIGQVEAAMKQIMQDVSKIEAILVHILVPLIERFYDDIEQKASADWVRNNMAKAIEDIQGILKEAYRGRLDRRKWLVDLDGSIREAVTSRWTELRGITVTYSGFDAEIPNVRVNGRHLMQVVKNIVINASRAMKEKEVGLPGIEKKLEIHIECVTEDDGGTPIEKVKIAITDNGIGIKQADLSKIWEQGWTTKATQAGHGIGLAISREMVDLAGGTIDCTSRFGQGTTFTLKYPVVAEVVGDEDELDTSTFTLSGDDGIGGGVLASILNEVSGDPCWSDKVSVEGGQTLVVLNGDISEVIKETAKRGQAAGLKRIVCIDTRAGRSDSGCNVVSDRVIAGTGDVTAAFGQYVNDSQKQRIDGTDVIFQQFDHHYGDVCLRGQTATALVIGYLRSAQSVDDDALAKELAQLQAAVFVTDHVDTDSILAQWVIHNWQRLSEEDLVFIEQLVYFSDYAFSLPGGVELVAGAEDRMRLLAEIIYMALRSETIGYAVILSQFWDIYRPLKEAADLSVEAVEAIEELPAWAKTAVREYVAHRERNIGLIEAAKSDGRIRCDESNGVAMIVSEEEIDNYIFLEWLRERYDGAIAVAINLTVNAGGDLIRSRIRLISGYSGFGVIDRLNKAEARRDIKIWRGHSSAFGSGREGYSSSLSSDVVFEIVRSTFLAGQEVSFRERVLSLVAFTGEAIAGSAFEEEEAEEDVACALRECAQSGDQNESTKSMAWHVLEAMDKNKEANGKVIYSLKAVIDNSSDSERERLESLVAQTRDRMFFYAEEDELAHGFEFLRDSLVTRDSVGAVINDGEIAVYMINDDERQQLGLSSVAPGRNISNRFIVPLTNGRNVANDIVLGLELVRVKGNTTDMYSLFQRLLIAAIHDWLIVSEGSAPETRIQEILDMPMPEPHGGFMQEVEESAKYIRAIIASA